MVLLLIAVVVGIAIGVARGGSPAGLAFFRVRLWPLAVVGALAIAAPAIYDTGASLVDADPEAGLPGAIVFYTAGLVLLVAVSAANAGRVTGSVITGIGFALNLGVALANGHVPLRPEAARAALLDGQPGEIQLLDDALWQLETADTRFAVLGDVIPLPLLGEVLSFGDLIMLAGLVVVIQNALLHRPERAISVDEFLADTEVIDLRSMIDLEAPAEPVGDHTRSPREAGTIDLTDHDPRLDPVEGIGDARPISESR